MDKPKGFAVPKAVRSTSKRTTLEAPSTSKKVIPKEKVNSRRSIAPFRAPSHNYKANTTLLCDESVFEPEDFDSVENDFEQSIFFRNLLSECLVKEKTKREETQMDIQMAQLAERFQETMDQLDKTSRRLKDINFVVEQKRLIDLKNQDCANFYNMTEDSGLESKVDNLTAAMEARLNVLETTNVDFGYDNESGHKKLLDTVNDAIDGLESIKKNYNFDTNIFNKYEELHTNLDGFEKNGIDIDSLKSEFDIKFPNFGEKLLKDMSDKIALFMENDD